MSRISSMCVPMMLILFVGYALYKKVNVYDSFVEGGKKALKLAYVVFPFVSSVLIMIALFRESGLSEMLTAALEKPLSAVGIPPSMAELLLLRPFSGSGTLAYFETLLQKYGGNSFEAKCAAVIMGSSETIFYVDAVNFSGTNVKKLRGAIAISLFCSFLGAVCACLLCRLG